MSVSHVGIAAFRAKRYEAALRRIGGNGRGLGQLIRNCAEKLPSRAVEALREVQRLRNILVHEDRVDRLAHPEKFIALINAIEDNLEIAVPDFVPQRMDLSDLDVKPVSATVVVANLPFSIDELDVYDFFAQIGRTLAVELAVDRNNLSRGVALVHMAGAREARDAVANFDHKTIYGCEILVFSSGSGRETDGKGESVARVMAQRESASGD
jgi:RNA recognition motif-containing protein